VWCEIAQCALIPGIGHSIFFCAANFLLAAQCELFPAATCTLVLAKSNVVADVVVKKTTILYVRDLPVGFVTVPPASQPPGIAAHLVCTTSLRTLISLGIFVGSGFWTSLGPVVAAVGPLLVWCGEGADPPLLELHPVTSPKITAQTTPSVVAMAVGVRQMGM
jgi:hypothetical protein